MSPETMEISQKNVKAIGKPNRPPPTNALRFRSLDHPKEVSSSIVPERPHEWNTARKNYPAKCVHELFQEQAKKTSNFTSVRLGTQVLTYGELNERTNRLARHLQKSGVTSETLVGICMNRSLEMVVAIFAILKAGAAFVPLDPEYPSERLLFMLRDAQAPVVLIQEKTAQIIPGGDCHLVCVDSDWGKIARESGENFSAKTDPEKLAYVIYTSGSTGTPKGVMISHGALSNHMFWMQNEFPLTEADRVLQKTSFSFDASIWEFFAPLMAGAQLVMAQPGMHRDVGYLAREIQESEITILQVVPSVLRLLLEEPQFKNCKTLKRLFCGGEALPTDLVNHATSLLDFTLINLYGPTEATIDSTFWICPSQQKVSIVPIGKPITHAAIYLLDHQLQPVPPGTPGELCIGGRGLARGYLNRTELTAEKFIHHPFSQKPGARLYKSGDLARFLSDGNLEYLGRIDHQVKIRGHRIEPGEIESALRLNPAIKDAVVVAREDSPGDQRLVAYFIATNREEVDASVLRAFLQEKLPEHMIPSAWVSLEKFPFTPAGKIDRQALPVPRLAPMENHVAPQTPLENKIAAIWSDVFQIGKISAEDSFFDLGGHSLLAMQIVTRIREQLMVELPLEIVFEGVTVRQMAEAVLKQMLDAEGCAELDEVLIGLNQMSHESVPQFPTQDAKQNLPERPF
jgi:amino acid adenylation domain-containing protein